LTREAAEINSKILQKYGYEMIQAISGNKGSTMWYGSEFRPPDDLERLFSYQDQRRGEVPNVDITRERTP